MAEWPRRCRLLVYLQRWYLGAVQLYLPLRPFDLALRSVPWGMAEPKPTLTVAELIAFIDDEMRMSHPKRHVNEYLRLTSQEVMDMHDIMRVALGYLPSEGMNKVEFRVEGSHILWSISLV